MWSEDGVIAVHYLYYKARRSVGLMGEPGIVRLLSLAEALDVYEAR